MNEERNVVTILNLVPNRRLLPAADSWNKITKRLRQVYYAQTLNKTTLQVQ